MSKDFFDRDLYLNLFRLRLLLHKALVKCCTTNEKSLSKMSTSDNEEDLTPDLDEFDSENDDEHLTLTQILQKISECNRLFFCFLLINLIGNLFSMFYSERTWCTKIT